MQGVLFNAATAWPRIVPLPAVLLTLGLMCAGTAAHAATAARASSFDYDPASGLLVKEVIEPDNPELCLVTTYTYDAYGNKTGATTRNCNGSAANAVTGAPAEAAAPAAGSLAIIVARTTTTTYDAQGRFPTAAANALGHTETRTYNANFGTVASLTGPNGFTTTWTYDSFGRKVSETRADGTHSGWSYTICASGCPANAQYYVTATADGTPGTTTYLDPLNRELRTQSVGFNGINILKDTVYDALGRVASVSRPYYANSSNIVWTDFDYDLLNRVVAETAPSADGAKPRGTTYYDYNGYTTTVTDALNHARTSVKNSQGQLVSVTDANNKTVTYAYDPFGNLIHTTDAAGNTTTLTYDLRGRKTAMVDPDMGAWSYAYNVLGELVIQTDAKGQVVNHTYDVLGRMLTRAEPDLITTWTYDSAPYGKGKVATIATDNGQQRTYVYDAYGRSVGVATLIDAATSYFVGNTYDAYGRVDTHTTPSGFSRKNIYNAYGHLAEVRNTATNALYWQGTAIAADGQITTASYGNGVNETRTLDNLGRITYAGAILMSGVVTSLSYDYDEIGNLKTRQDAANGITENYAYDALYRLTGSSGTNVPAKSLQYDDLGNITYKSDTGTYTYAALRANGSNRPHAVSAVTGSWNTSFTYDANGNLVSGGGRTYVYTSYNLPAQITTASGTLTLVYGADHERAKEIEPDGTVSISLNPRLDSGAHFDRRYKPNGVVEQVNYIYAANRPVGIYTERSNGNNELRYFHLDAQGSIVAITDENGAVIERLSYDAWGKRRHPNGSDDSANTLVALITDHGYTGHEHIDEVGLIHMNGRVFDPRLGRFLQADPTIQAPGNLQSYNRYTYTLNNPFFYTDPSGYFSLGSLLSPITDIVREVNRAVDNVAREIGRASRNDTFKTVAAVAGAWYLGPMVFNNVYGALMINTEMGVVAAGMIAGAASGATVGALMGATATGGLTPEFRIPSVARLEWLREVGNVQDTEAELHGRIQAGSGQAG